MAKPTTSETHYFMQEINYTFEEVKRDTEDFLKNNITQKEHLINNTDLQNILEEHMNKVELVIRHCMESIEAKNKLTQEEVQKETTKMKKSIGAILLDLKKNLRNYVTNQKNKVTYQVRNTKEVIISRFKNSYTRRMLTINGQLKKLSMKIDQKLSVETVQINPEEKLQKDSEEMIQTKSSEKETTNINENNEVGLEKIEKMSKKIGLNIKDEERRAITNLSEKQKESLIETLKNEIEKNKEEKNISVATEDIELEIG